MMRMTTTRMEVGCPITDSVANKTNKIGDRHEAARLRCASAREMGRFVDTSKTDRHELELTAARDRGRDRARPTSCQSSP